MSVAKELCEEAECTRVFDEFRASLYYADCSALEAAHSLLRQQEACGDLIKDVEGEMMRTLRRPRGMAKLRSVETKIVKDVDSSFLQQTEAVKKSPKVH